MELPFSPLPELEVAIDAATKAGKAIMQVYGTDFKSETKGDDSPITEADLKSNIIIKEILQKTNHMILSEEDKDNKERLRQKLVWIVDPLDGTTDFVKRTGEFTVMIALVEDKKPKLGVINWPTENTMFLAQQGQGAFKIKEDKIEKISVTNTSELSKCRAVGSRHHLSEQEKELLARLEISNFTSIGSSLKVGKISSGEAEVYLTTTDKMKEWDSCASYCIVTEAGGKMTDMLGQEMTYNNEIVNHQNGILVSNGKIHEKIVKEFEKLK